MTEIEHAASVEASVVLYRPSLQRFVTQSVKTSGGSGSGTNSSDSSGKSRSAKAWSVWAHRAVERALKHDTYAALAPEHFNNATAHIERRHLPVPKGGTRRSSAASAASSSSSSAAAGAAGSSASSTSTFAPRGLASLSFPLMQLTSAPGLSNNAYAEAFVPVYNPADVPLNVTLLGPCHNTMQVPTEEVLAARAELQGMTSSQRRRREK